MGNPGYLEVVNGSRLGQLFQLKPGNNLLGREEHCDVWIPDEGTSRQHAAIEVADRVMVRDLGSANGTKLNGNMVDEAVLESGDRIQIAQTVFCYRSSGRETVVIGEERKMTVVTRIERPSRSEEARPGEVPEKHLQRLQSICRVASEISDSDGTDGMLGIAAAALAEEIEFDRGAIELVDQPTVAFDGTGKRLGRQFRLSRGVTGSVRDLGQPILFVAEEDHELAERRSIISSKTSSALCVPLVHHHELVGLIYLDRRDRGRFTDEDLRFLADLASHIGPKAGDLLALAHHEGAHMVAVDPRSQQLLETVDRVAVSDSPILLLGETGVGKDVFARWIHEHSQRKEGPFVPLNMAALPDSLVEAELFGHAKGAFTGADRANPGKFRIADGGTLFLDEVGELQTELQAKLLRVLETGEFFPVGAEQPVKVDVRIVAATNQELASQIEDGRFRQDLYYRLAVVELKIPPLRERPGDILPLARYFVSMIAERLDREPPVLAQNFTDALRRHPWPGNVRELRNVIERVLVLAGSRLINAGDLPSTFSESTAPPNDAQLPLMSLKEAEAWAITRALEYTGGKKGEAAKILGTTYPTLNKKMKAYGIELP